MRQDFVTSLRSWDRMLADSALTGLYSDCSHSTIHWVLFDGSITKGKQTEKFNLSETGQRECLLVNCIIAFIYKSSCKETNSSSVQHAYMIYHRFKIWKLCIIPEDIILSSKALCDFNWKTKLTSLSFM